MSNWRLARTIETLRDRVLELRPDTKGRMYGTIGDPAHASRFSDHNPWIKDAEGVGVVRALDIPLSYDDGGLRLANKLRRMAKGNKVLRIKPHIAFGGKGYIIFNRKIASKATNWKWVPYYGTNPHVTHIHVSVGRVPERYDADVPWTRIKKRHVTP